jgi:hypothetical protein
MEEFSKRTMVVGCMSKCIAGNPGLRFGFLCAPDVVDGETGRKYSLGKEEGEGKGREEEGGGRRGEEDHGGGLYVQVRWESGTTFWLPLCPRCRGWGDWKDLSLDKEEGGGRWEERGGWEEEGGG